MKKSIVIYIIFALIVVELVSCKSNSKNNASLPVAGSNNLSDSSVSGKAIHNFLKKSTAEVFTDNDQKCKIPYRIYVPKTSNDNCLPLMLFLSGVGGRGSDNVLQTVGDGILNNLTENPQHPCILLAPQCPANAYWCDVNSYQGWRNASGIDMLTVLHDLIKSLEKQYRVDTKRLYITGFSMGGFGTYSMVLKYPNMFACAVPCAGWGDMSAARKMINTPIWAFHGEADDNIPASLDKNLTNQIIKYGGKVKYTAYPGVGHNCWDKAYNNPSLITWIFSSEHSIK